MVPYRIMAGRCKSTWADYAQGGGGGGGGPVSERCKGETVYAVVPCSIFRHTPTFVPIN